MTALEIEFLTPYREALRGFSDGCVTYMREVETSAEDPFRQGAGTPGLTSPNLPG